MDFTIQESGREGAMEKSIYSEQYTELLNLLKQTRKKASITQEQLAESLGQTQSFVSKVERGERRLDVVEIRAFCSALGVDFPSTGNPIRRTQPFDENQADLRCRFRLLIRSTNKYPEIKRNFTPSSSSATASVSMVLNIH